MRKSKYILIIVLLICLRTRVFATSMNVGISCPSTAYSGDTISCTISASSSDGTLNGINGHFSFENLSFNSFNKGGSWQDYGSGGNGFVLGNTSGVPGSSTLGTISLTVTGRAGNNASITISGVDGSDTDFNSLTGNSTSKTISIIEKTVEEIPSNNSNINVATTKPRTTRTTTTTKPIGNAFLSTISIEGIDFSFNKDTLEYNLTVDNNINNISITAIPEDKTSEVKINKDNTLNVGDNKIEIVVTATDKTTKTYILNIKREELLSIVNNDIEMIKKALNQDQKEIIVKVDKTDQNKNITKDVLELLKEKKKNIVFEIYENDIKQYSFKIIGKNISNANTINYNITFNSKYGDNIKNIFQNKKYKIINFDFSGNLPIGTEVSVLSKELDKETYFYYYNPNTNTAEYINNYKKNKNYVTFNIDHCSEYILSNSKLKNSNNIKVIALTIIILEIITIIFILIKSGIINLKSKKV